MCLAFMEWNVTSLYQTESRPRHSKARHIDYNYLNPHKSKNFPLGRKLEHILALRMVITLLIPPIGQIQMDSEFQFQILVSYINRFKQVQNSSFSYTINKFQFQTSNTIVTQTDSNLIQCWQSRNRFKQETIFQTSRFGLPDSVASSRNRFKLPDSNFQPQNQTRAPKFMFTEFLIQKQQQMGSEYEQIT